MTFGSMSVKRWMEEGHFGKRVLINGMDITNRCRWFDDETGEAECFVLDDAGNHVLGDDNDPRVEKMTGRIEVVG